MLLEKPYESFRKPVNAFVVQILRWFLSRVVVGGSAATLQTTAAGRVEESPLQGARRMSPRLTWTVDEAASAALRASTAFALSGCSFGNPPSLGYNVTLRCGPCGKGANPGGIRSK